VVFANQFWGEHLFHWFPRIVRFWVSLPLYEVLKSPRPPVVSVIHNGFYFEFLFASYQVRRWSRVTRSVLIGLAIGSQQTCMEDVMDGPGRWQFQSVGYRGYSMGNKKGAMTSRG
jgi:hypothetical protein